MKDISKVMYIVVDKEGKGWVDSLSRMRSASINRFLTDLSMTWNEFKKMGWKCEKVSVSIESFSDREPVERRSN